MKPSLTAVLGIVLLVGGGIAAGAEKSIRTLILTGHDGPFHDWRATSKALKDVLQQDSRFSVRVVTDPEHLATADLLAYDLVVQNYVNWQKPGLSDKAKANLLSYLRAGRGLAVIHFANGAFHFSLPGAKASDWPEYRKIVRRVWDHTGKSGHDRYGDFRVQITSAKHSITEGMKDFDTTDELYYRQAGDQPITPLVTARSKDTGKDEPLAWAYSYDKARIFQTLLGHSEKSIRGAGPALLLRRGCVWAAGRDQLPIPRVKEETRPIAKLVEGKFGKALDASVTPVAFTGDERYRTPPLTVECWARLNSKRGFNVLVSSDPKSSSRHWEIYSYAGSGAFSAYLPGYTPAEVISKTSICDGKWHYLATTFDGKRVVLYVDGRKVHEADLKPTTDRKPVAGPLSVGQAIDGPIRIGCDGLIDDVRLSRVVRTIKEVPTGPLPVDADTIGVWRFDDSEKILADPAWTPPPAAAGEAWERATDVDWVDARLRQMDTGPTFNATMRYPHGRGQVPVHKATAIRIGEKGEGAVIFDRNQLRLAAGWTGGYLHHSDVRFGLLNTPTPVGKMVFSTASGPGWAGPKGTWSTTHPATLPLPRELGRYKGHYLSGKRVVLAYTVGGAEVFESPWLETIAGQTVLVRTIEVGPRKRELSLLLGDLPGEKKFQSGQRVTAVTFTRYGSTAALLVVRDDKTLPSANSSGVQLNLPPHDKQQRFEVMSWVGRTKELPALVKALETRRAPSDLSKWRKGGPARYPNSLVTRGEVAADTAPHVVDTLTVPYENPHKALFFLTGHDFLPNGDIAVCTAHGDVWLVKGADAKLEKLTWKRFATGLYQPLGLKVVDGKIVVLERGQLTRLHDLDGDGEADFYENLCNDWHTGSGEHSFDTCLEADAEGRFYFFKTGDTHLPHGGCLMRVSRDGTKTEVFATGFRHPIGLSVSPSGVVTGADQEGNWMPATRIDIYRKGGFYGDMRAHHRAKPPATYDLPLLWLPKEADNSAGGQVWVPHERFGLPKEQMLHLSFGRCKLYAVLPQTVGTIQQAGAVDMGLFFLSGSMRGRFHPRDGHLYVTGLNGWQTAARRDGCLQRVRYTGKPLSVPVDLHVQANGIRLRFARALDAKTAGDRSRYKIEQWNYRWSADYGSKHYSVREPHRVGHDTLTVASAVPAKDGRSVFLEVKGLVPAMQMRIGYDIQAADGKPLSGAVYSTIHRLAAAE
jgi:type 1 glutamine amidotransferase